MGTGSFLFLLVLAMAAGEAAARELRGLPPRLYEPPDFQIIFPFDIPHRPSDSSWITPVCIGVAITIVGTVLIIWCCCRRTRGDSETLPRGLPRGLHSAVIEMFPTRAWAPAVTSRSDLQMCSICLDTFQQGDVLRVLPCYHDTYHADCIDEWLSQVGSCPICRRVFSDAVILFDADHDM